MAMARRKFRSGPDGITANFNSEERSGLATVLQQFRDLLVEGHDASMLRFQPPVHIQNEHASEEFWEMAAVPLLRHRLEAIDVVEAGLEGVALDDEAVSAWLQTLNSLRLYLGNTLEVGTASFDPAALNDERHDMARYMLYEWLGGILDQLVETAAETLPSGDSDGRP